MSELPPIASSTEFSDGELSGPSSNRRPQVKGVSANKWEWEQALKDRSRKEGMTPGCQHVALLMSTYADGDGTKIRPSAQKLVDVSGKSRASVHEALRYLRNAGWVHQVSRGAGATRRASVYRLTIPPKVP